MSVHARTLHLNALTLKHWRADLGGGLQAAAVALPMGLAFGVVSGVGPVAGLYSAICTGLFAALFGGTPTQISGPTGPIAIVMASIFASFPTTTAFAIVMLAGAMQIGFGALRLGRYVSLMPYPVMSGFSTAVGCIIIVMQFNPLLGHAPVSDTVAAVLALPRSIEQASLSTVSIALLCLGACHWMPIGIRRYVPAHLIVLVVATLLVAMIGLPVPRLPAPESLLPELVWPRWTELPWRQMWFPAVVLALVSSLDSLLTSLTAESATQQVHDAERELVGQGLGNMFAGLLGALPGAGSTFRTLANIEAGGKTPLSAVAHSAVLLGLLVSAGSLIRMIPASVLAGILVYIGLGIIDWRYIRRFPFAPRGGVLIMLVVWFTALFVNVVTGAAVGMVMASLALVKRLADLQAASIRRETGASSRLDDRESAALAASADKALLISLAGPLTFGAASQMTRRLADIREYEVVVLDFTAVPHIDESAIVAVENVIRRARDSEQTVMLVGLGSPVLRAFAGFGLLPLVKGCMRFKRRLDALEHAARICAGSAA